MSRAALIFQQQALRSTWKETGIQLTANEKIGSSILVVIGCPDAAAADRLCGQGIWYECEMAMTVIFV